MEKKPLQGNKHTCKQLLSSDGFYSFPHCDTQSLLTVYLALHNVPFICVKLRLVFVPKTPGTIIVTYVAVSELFGIK